MSDWCEFCDRRDEVINRLVAEKDELKAQLDAALAELNGIAPRVVKDHEHFTR